jgi:putative Mg2+ transporter-C (MgtC) family protein
MRMELDLAGWPDLAATGRVALRLAGAAALGGLIGFEREQAGKAAGLRTHMMVALGAALFVVVPIEVGLGDGDLTRVIQGIAAGMGFLGGGTILKRTNSDDIEGLTSAATIWFTGAIGIAAGAGLLWVAAIGVVCAWVVLKVALGLDSWTRRRG